jgi:hypothetical protein
MMKKMLRIVFFTILLAAVFVITLCGCGESVSQDEYVFVSEEKADDINPQSNVGKLKVELPPDLANGEEDAFHPILVYYRPLPGEDVFKVSIGETYYVTPGKGCIVVDQDISTNTLQKYKRDLQPAATEEMPIENWHRKDKLLVIPDNRTQDCSVTVKKQELTTYKLSALELDWDVEDFKVEAGPEPVFNLDTKVPDEENESEEPLFNRHLSVFLHHPPEEILFVFPQGTYHIFYTPTALHNAFGDQTVSLEAGSVQSLSLKPGSESRGTVNFEFSSQSYENPHQHATYNFGQGDVLNVINTHFVLRRKKYISDTSGRFTPTEFVVQNYDHSYWKYVRTCAYFVDRHQHKPDWNPLEGAISIRMYPADPMDGGGEDDHYEYVVNNQSMKLEVRSNQTITVIAERINIGDVITSTGNQEEISIPGEYIISYFDEESNDWVKMKVPYFREDQRAWNSFDLSASTSTGINVQTGKRYQAKIDYKFPDGTERQQIWECDYTQPYQDSNRCSMIEDVPGN